jgi:hypothetical protein
MKRNERTPTNKIMAKISYRCGRAATGGIADHPSVGKVGNLES